MIAEHDQAFPGSGQTVADLPAPTLALPAPLAPGQLVPAPPARSGEISRYRRRRRLRPAVAVSFASGAGALYGIFEVFSRSRAWWPFLTVLVVLVPYWAYMVVLAILPAGSGKRAHRQVKRRASPMLRASVDVFLCACGEDLAILENTFRHVGQLQWEGPLNVYVLDDGADPAVPSLAACYGLTYLTRPDRGMYKKAGNLNYGLASSRGAFIAVLDAGFAPAPSFLAETIPYFADPATGIVQTSQYFDVSSRRTRNWIQQMAGSIQDSFSCWAQPSQDRLGAAMCVGTSVVYRRAALEKAGGWPKISGGEDVITGILLTAAGYRTVYVPLNWRKVSARTRSAPRSPSSTAGACQPSTWSSPGSRAT